MFFSPIAAEKFPIGPGVLDPRKLKLCHIQNALKQLENNKKYQVYLKIIETCKI